MKKTLPVWMVTVLLFLTTSTLTGRGVAAAVPAGGENPSDTDTKAPRVVVAVFLQSPDFTVREMKYRVFYNKSEVKRIPLTDYDFGAAFLDELLNALSEDTRMEWRGQSEGEEIDVPELLKGKATPPQVEADRLLLVQISEYGAFVPDLAADKFYITARLKLVDRASGKKLWSSKLNSQIDLEGKVAELQADNQRGLKTGINTVLEKLCSKIAGEVRRARI